MPALTTPFSADGRLDEDALGRNMERLLAAGSTGFLVGGCTGEFWAMSMAERKRLFEIAAGILSGRGTLLVGTGAPTTSEVIELVHHAEKVGCDGAVILPPYFVKASDDEIYAHYSDISAAVTLPIMLYNIPGNAVNALTPQLVERLARLERVVAIKESSGDWNNFYGTLIAVQDQIRVFCGPASIFGVPAVELGADGTIDCFPNVWPDGGQPLYEAARDGDLVRAAALQAKGRRLTDLFTSEGRTLYPATKAAMNLMGVAGGGFPRLPLRPIEGEALERFDRALAEMGLVSGSASVERRHA